MKKLIIRAHAKINLVLGVGPARPDGFHRLKTIFHSLSLHNTISFRPMKGAHPKHYLRVTGLDADKVPVDSSNLVLKALDFLVPNPPFPLDIHIDKGIPTAGGMAGGSADCAAALLAANRLYSLNFSQAELLSYAAALGSDIPFSMLGGTQIGSGRGEILRPLACSQKYHWVVAVNTIGLSTPSVFHEFDSLDMIGPAYQHMGDVYISAFEAAFRAPTYESSVLQLAHLIANDLEPAALSLRPDLHSILEAGTESGAVRSFISGSGPTCVFLCYSKEHARIVSQGIRDKLRYVSTFYANSYDRGCEFRL